MHKGQGTPGTLEESVRPARLTVPRTARLPTFNAVDTNIGLDRA